MALSSLIVTHWTAAMTGHSRHAALEMWIKRERTLPWRMVLMGRGQNGSSEKAGKKPADVPTAFVSM